MQTVSPVGENQLKPSTLTSLPDRIHSHEWGFQALSATTLQNRTDKSQQKWIWVIWPDNKKLEEEWSQGTRTRKSPHLSYAPIIIANVQDWIHDVSINWARIQLFSSSITAVVTAVICRCTAKRTTILNRWNVTVWCSCEIHKSGFENSIQEVYPQHADRWRQYYG